MSEALEQILSDVRPTISDDRMYATIDQYATGYLDSVFGLYSFDFDPEPFGPAGPLDFMDAKHNPIGSQGSGFKPGGYGNIRKEIIDGLQERYDASGHDESKLHINYDLLGADGEFSRDALGDAHNIDLSYLFKDLHKDK